MKLESHKLLSTLAFKCNLRRHIKEMRQAAAPTARPPAPAPAAAAAAAAAKKAKAAAAPPPAPLPPRVTYHGGAASLNNSLLVSDPFPKLRVFQILIC